MKLCLKACKKTALRRHFINLSNNPKAFLSSISRIAQPIETEVWIIASQWENALLCWYVTVATSSKYKRILVLANVAQLSARDQSGLPLLALNKYFQKANLNKKIGRKGA